MNERSFIVKSARVKFLTSRTFPLAGAIHLNRPRQVRRRSDFVRRAKPGACAGLPRARIRFYRITTTFGPGGTEPAPVRRGPILNH